MYILSFCILAIFAVFTIAISLSNASAASFIKDQHSYDINAGSEYVLYTNFACPYCADLHNKLIQRDNIDPTIRILMLGHGERFQNEGVISSFMLKLSRENPVRFAEMQTELYNNQDSWISLSWDEVLDWLNSRADTDWIFDDLTAELAELMVLMDEAPADCIGVPNLYKNSIKVNSVLDENPIGIQ